MTGTLAGCSRAAAGGPANTSASSATDSCSTSSTKGLTPMASDREKRAFKLVGDHVSVFQRGRRWYANFQLNGKQHRKALGTTSKKEARRLAIQLEAEILQGRYQRTVPPPTL